MNRLIFVGALASLMASSALAQTLTGLVTSKAGAGVEVRILGDGLTKPRFLKLGEGKYAAEFDGKLSGKSLRESVNFGGVRSVSTQTVDGKTVRVVLSVDESSFVALSERGKNFVITVNGTAASAASSALPLLQVGKAPAAQMNRTVIDGLAKSSGRPVSLDFVNTEIVQILKALAMQSGVNIVTGPEVKGQLTVSLRNVSVTEALDLVTTLANVRYAKVGHTYVVTGNERYADAMRQVGGMVQATSETRVVPIYSGEGTHIKAAVLKSASPGGRTGGVEIVLPSDEITVQQKDVVAADETAPTTAADGQTVVDTKSAARTGSSAGSKKDSYVVLIGPTDRLDEFEKLIRSVDEQICRATGVEVPSTSAAVRKVYRPVGSSAASLLMAVSGEKPSAGGGVYKAKVGSVEMFATPSGSISDQVIVLYGRETEVNQMLTNMENIDAVGQSRGDYLIYEVHHLDPRALREELLVQVPGLSVSIPSNAAANPNLYVAGAARGESAERVGTSGAASGTAGNDTATREGQVSLQADTGEAQGLTLPFRDAEKVSVPMKLVLRGSKEQIQNALQYLSVVDVAPKQVALELRVMELTKEDALRVGLDWSILTGGTVKSLRFNNGIESSSATPGTASGVLGFAGGGTLSILSTLDQLANNRNLIARPNLVATDGRETELFVGDVVRYIKSIQATQNGITVETGEVPVGVRLAVLPRVGGDGQVTLDLRPAVTTLNGFTPVPGGGNLPQTGLRIAQSTMTVNSGETIAIGGLIQDVDRKRESGIPILKDLPIIGMLFKRTENSRTRSEVVFFLTAKVVDSTNRKDAANPASPNSVGASASDKVGQ